MSKILQFKKEEMLGEYDFFKKNHGSDKFVLACYHDNGDLASFVSENLDDRDLCYIIQTLKDRRETIFRIDNPEY